MLQERCRPLAQSGVIKAPRVQLENGLLRTKQKPTSLPTLHDNTRSRGAAKKFHTRRVGTTGEQLEKLSERLAKFDWLKDFKPGPEHSGLTLNQVKQLRNVELVDEPG
jgi:hypothetical protein